MTPDVKAVRLGKQSAIKRGHSVVRVSEGTDRTAAFTAGWMVPLAQIPGQRLCWLLLRGLALQVWSWTRSLVGNPNISLMIVASRVGTEMHGGLSWGSR